MISLEIPVEKIPYVRTIEGRKFKAGKWEFPDSALPKLQQYGLVSSDIKVENLEKVKGSFFNSGQYQIILGTGLVNRIYDEVVKVTGTGDEEKSEEKEKVVYGNKFQRAIRMFSDVFVPIIPVLVATGLFMGLRGLLTQEAVLAVFGLTADSIPQNLLTFTQVLTDTAFAFLPALVCWSTFRNFGGSPVIGIVLGLMLVNSSLPSAYAVGSGEAQPLIFFGFLKVTGYQGSVLPAFVLKHIQSFV